MTEKSIESIGLTAQLAKRVFDISFDSLPIDTRRIAKQCILDFVGVMVTGAREPVVRSLVAEASGQGGRPEVSVVGQQEFFPAIWAATINSTAGHVLAYDDVNMAIPGHGTAVSLPAVLALAEKHDFDGRDVMQAYVAGFEAACSIGDVAGPDHYDRGFHASATVGTYGAAMAAGRLLKMDAAELVQVVAAAGCLASGTKSAFGTMMKAYQVGKAAGNGILAAGLVRNGLSGRTDSLEADQGFLATQGRTEKLSVLSQPEGNYYIQKTLFKYHASCYLSHAVIEAAIDIRRVLSNSTRDVAKINVTVNPICDKVCNIPQPTSAMQICYSLKALVSMALMGIDMSTPEAINPGLLSDQVMTDLMQKVHIDFDAGLNDAESILVVSCVDGSEQRSRKNVGEPVSDLGAQEGRILAKFRALVEPRLGSASMERVIDMVLNLERLRSIRPLMSAIRGEA